VISTEGILPGTRFAVDAYVRFVRERSLLEAIASSLTELFAPKIHEERIAGLLEHYDFANERTVAYFKKRLGEAPRDVNFSLDYVRRQARTREQQEQVLAALRFKTDVLWSQLDALYYAFIEIQYCRELAPAALIDPLLGGRESGETRETVQRCSTNGDLSYESPGGLSAERYDLCHARPDIDNAAFATQCAVGIGVPDRQE